MKKSAIVYTHLGMGDCIDCAGLVRHIAESYEKVYIFSKEIYYKSIKFLYRDEPRIIVVTIPKEIIEGSFVWPVIQKIQKTRNIESKDTYIIGHGNYGSWTNRGYRLGHAFYAMVNLPYSTKFEKFYFQRDEKEEDRVYSKLNPDNEKYVFVHDDPTRNIHLPLDTKYKVIKNDPSEQFFHMMKVWENAEEIHCMHSSLCCFLDCVAKSPLVKNKLNEKPKFLHWNIRKVHIPEDYLCADNWIMVADEDNIFKDKYLLDHQKG